MRIACCLSICLLALLFSSTYPLHAEDIHDAVREGDLPKVRALIEGAPGKVNARDSDGKTPMHYAAANGEMAIAEWLADHGADLSARSKSGFTPLRLAKGSGRTELAAFLEKKGASLTGSAPAALQVARPAPAPGFAPQNDPLIMTLARQGDVDKVKALIHQDPSLAVTTNRGGENLLTAAAGAGQTGVVQLLLQSGADVNARSPRGDSALHRAVTKNNAALVEMLLAQRAEVNITNRMGLTPLFYAASRKDEQLVKLLLAKGADPNLTGPGSGSPMLLALQARNINAVKLLLDAKADVNAAFSDGTTALHQAVQTAPVDIAALLIERKAGVNAKTRDGDTPLDLALQAGREDMLELLKKHGAQPGPEAPLSGPARSLVEAYKKADKVLHHGTAAERKQALMGWLPTRDDVGKVFLKNADRAWAMDQEEVKRINAELDKGLQEMAEEGEAFKIRVRGPGPTVQALREKGWMSPTVPVHCLDVWRRGSMSSSTEYFFVNDHWVMMPAPHRVFSQ